MHAISYIGAAAAVCTTLAYLPQVIRAWRTRSTHDVSLKMYILMVMGTVLWLAYGVALMDWPLIAANAVSLVFTGSILFLKLRYG
ncbi:MAG TPA: SemiSWEET transporter [Rhizomicrobium sp.]|nr:SemiSWEET transporter [Rhizomicrobium sp.]